MISFVSSATLTFILWQFGSYFGNLVWGFLLPWLWLSLRAFELPVTNCTAEWSPWLILSTVAKTFKPTQSQAMNDSYFYSRKSWTCDIILHMRSRWHRFALKIRDQSWQQQQLTQVWGSLVRIGVKFKFEKEKKTSWFFWLVCMEAIFFQAGEKETFQRWFSKNNATLKNL